jgi:predicted nucleic acid-binding protein
MQQVDWYIPAPVIAEIQEGAEAAPSQARRAVINGRLDAFLSNFGLLVADWDTETSRIWGRLKHSPEVRRQPQTLWDSLIDAMAVRFDAHVATRNAKDFRHAKTFDPWSEELDG